MFLGRCWQSTPLVSSFEPRFRGECGSQKCLGIACYGSKGDSSGGFTRAPQFGDIRGVDGAEFLERGAFENAHQI
jgi:hypothetical protein